MEKENAELKKLVQSLESELGAALRREELLLNPIGGSGKLKQKLKRTKIGAMIANPNSKIGKIARLPRTTVRIMLHPSILKEIFAKKNQEKKSKYDNDESMDKLVFEPVRFFESDYDGERFNVVFDTIDVDLLKMAIELANKRNVELRVITCAEGTGSMMYSEMVKKKELPKAKKISFYSSLDQSQKNKIFQLEVGKKDIFITKIRKKTDAK